MRAIPEHIFPAKTCSRPLLSRRGLFFSSSGRAAPTGVFPHDTRRKENVHVGTHVVTVFRHPPAAPRGAVSHGAGRAPRARHRGAGALRPPRPEGGGGRGPARG